MNIRSMTGFARVRRLRADGEVVLSLKSLNHRGLDLHFHIPSEFDPYEPAMRGVAKRLVMRGHLEVRLAVQKKGQASASGLLNRPLLEAYLAAFDAAAKEYNLGGSPDLNAAFRLPGMFAAGAEEEPDKEMESVLVSLMEEGLGVLNTFRSREGAEIAALILARSASIQEGVAKIAAIRSRSQEVFQARLRERLIEILRGANIEPQRLVQEAAILADRSDIGEEIARLEIHAQQLDEIVNAGGETGKKLDFLLQEMNRETNTILSKTNGIGEIGLKITEIAIAIKSDTEKVREQSLNLE